MFYYSIIFADVYIEFDNILNNYLYFFHFSRGVDLKCVETGEYANEIFWKYNMFDNDVLLCVLRFWRVNVFRGITIYCS